LIQILCLLILAVSSKRAKIGIFYVKTSQYEQIFSIDNKSLGAYDFLITSILKPIYLLNHAQFLMRPLNYAKHPRKSIIRKDGYFCQISDLLNAWVAEGVASDINDFTFDGFVARVTLIRCVQIFVVRSTRQVIDRVGIYSVPR
jgi:hypothetical protein